MTALESAHRAYRAWARSQPQLILDLWDEAGLDEQDAGASVLLVEPATAPPITSPGDGLTVGGTEPRHRVGAAGYQPVSGHPTSLSGVSVGAAFSTTTEAGANHCPVTRARLQKGL